MSGTKSEIAYVITRSRSSFGTVRKSRSFQGLPHDFGTDCSPERRFLRNTGLECGTKLHQRSVTRTHFQSGEPHIKARAIGIIGAAPNKDSVVAGAFDMGVGARTVASNPSAAAIGHRDFAIE